MTPSISQTPSVDPVPTGTPLVASTPHVMPHPSLVGYDARESLVGGSLKLERERKTSLEKAASPLVEALLNPDPSARLGMPVAGDRGKGEAALKNHSFFKDKAIKTDLNKMRSVQSPLIARLVKEKEIIATNATEDTHSLLELFFAETAISGAEKAAGKHWLDELA